LRGKCSKAVLLSALIITALLVPFIASSSTTAESADGLPAPLGIVGDYHIILEGKDTAHGEDHTRDPWEVHYLENSNPPLMVGKKEVLGVGSGAVIAAGLGRTCNGGITYGTQRWTTGELNVLLDNAFQWMKSGAENVLWYGEYLASLETDNKYEYTFNDANACSWLIDNFRARGYTVDNTIDSVFTEITSGLLAPYDILVLPGLQLRDGDPIWLPDNVLQTIKTWVEGGGGLFIMDVGDFDPYNNYLVSNEILENLGFLYYFQDDGVEDSENNLGGDVRAPIVDVNTETWVGEAYENKTGKNYIQLYKVCTLRSLIEIGVAVSSEPKYRDVLPGASVTFEIRVKNLSNSQYDNFKLENVDNLGWVSLENSLLVNLAPGETKTTTLTVTVPDNKELYGVTDNITITATSQLDNTVSTSHEITVYVCTWIAPPTSDAQVVENFPARNYGEYTYLYVGSSTTAYKNERSYLKFDLGEGLPAGYTIENARLYLYCFTTMGALGKNVRIYGLGNDAWLENELTWNNQPAGNLTLLDTVSVTENSRWYSWNVTSFLENYPTDNIVSFCIKAETEGQTYPDNFSYGFDAKEYADSYQHPYLAFGVRPVPSIIENYGLPGKNAIVNVVIYNRGALMDNYDVTIASQSGWTVNPSARVENNIPPGENRVIPVTVTIPGNASLSVWENLIVTATSKKDNKFTSSTTDNGVYIGYWVYLVADWNCVSLHVVNDNILRGPKTTKRNLFTDIGIDPLTVSMGWVDPYAGYQVVGLDEQLKDNTGYYIKPPSSAVIRPSGIPKDNENVYLVADWNLVGFPVVNASTTKNNLFTEAGVNPLTVSMGWYDPYLGYQVVGLNDLLKDNTGYWIKPPSSVTLRLP